MKQSFMMKRPNCDLILFQNILYSFQIDHQCLNEENIWKKNLQKKNHPDPFWVVCMLKCEIHLSGIILELKYMQSLNKNVIFFTNLGTNFWWGVALVRNCQTGDKCHMDQLFIYLPETNVKCRDPHRKTSTQITSIFKSFPHFSHQK